MSVAIERALDGQRILIVESDIQFQRQLQEALEREDAETVTVTDPNSVVGARQITHLVFTAAVINDWHLRVHHTLGGMPVVVYGGRAPVPAQIDSILVALKALLTDRT